VLVKRGQNDGYRKIQNHNSGILKQELKLADRRLISAEQSSTRRRDTVLTRYKKRATRLLLFVIYIIGAVLSRGVISFVAANWESIPAAAKVAIIVPLMLACHFIGYIWAYFRHKPPPRPLLCRAGNTVFGANIGLWRQIFHIQSEFLQRLFRLGRRAVIRPMP